MLGPFVTRPPRHVQIEMCTPVLQCPTMRVGVRELRNQTAAWIRRAGDGERVIVTVDGRPVAQLGPIDGDAPGLEDLAARGLVVLPRRDDRPTVAARQVLWNGFRLDRALQEVRGR